MVSIIVLKLPRQHNKKLFTIPIFLVAVGFILFIPKSSAPQAAMQTAKYDYKGPHMFSAWAIIRSEQHPFRVIANNTGIMSEYLTLKALNATIVGMHWDGNKWQNLTQTGWYWDANHSLLYLHFQTWDNDKYHVTEINVDVPINVVSTVTMTQTFTETVTQTVTETATVTVTYTVTSTITHTSTVTTTVVSIQTMTVTTTSTITRTCTIVCLP